MMSASMDAPIVAQAGSVGRVPIAALTGVRKCYGKVEALHDLTLDLYPGEIVAVLGPNGAGKSTAVRLLLGLTTPTAGTARIFGEDPRTAATRTRIGAMLQVASMPKTLQVKEHLDLFRSYYPKPLACAEVVRIAQLEGIEERQFDQLSGGQKQRLLFGLAICGDPEIVFLDEPTVGLDVEARRSLWEAVRGMAARGKTVLLTTHYLDEADALATRIVVVDRGRVIREGTPAEIKRETAARKIRCVTSLTVNELRAIPGVLTVEQNGGTMCVTAGNAEEALRIMLAADAGLSGLEVVAPGLEDAFLALTSGGS